jgi:hypothetical protein
MLDRLPFELLHHHIIAYTTVEDVCHLMETSSDLYSTLNHIELSEVKVRGFQLYEFVMWLQKHQISKVKYLKIYDYNMRNDHCMYSYKEDCDCVNEIKRGLEGLEIETLILSEIKIDDSDMVTLAWSRNIRKLHLINYNFDSDMRWLQKTLPDIRELQIDYQYSDHEVFFMPSLAFLQTGIQNVKLERFLTNMFFFGEDLEVMLRNSYKNENLKVFSLSEISPSSVGKEIMELIKELYPNSKMTVVM